VLSNYRAFFQSTLFPGLLVALLFSSASLTGCGLVPQIPSQPDTHGGPASSQPGAHHLNQQAINKYQSLSAQAMALVNEKRLADAIPLLNKAIAIKKAEGPDEELGRLYGNLGYVYSTLKRSKEAEDAYYHALKCASQGSQLAKDSQRDYDYAHSQLLRSNPEVQKLAQQARSLSDSAFAIAKTKNYDKAIEQFNKAIETRKSLPPDDDLAQLYANLGWAYSNKKNWAKADAAYAKALQIASPTNANKKFYERDKAYAHSQAGGKSK